MARSRLDVTKAEAARRQLETAVVLYFHSGDPVSVHTLASAAYDVLRDLSRPNGGMIKDWLPDSVRPEFKKVIRDRLNEAQNYFKHADRDREQGLSFDPSASEILILDATWAYRRLTGERPAVLGVFELWGFLTFAKEYVTYEGAEHIDPTLRNSLSLMSRQSFFDEILPTAHRASVARPDA